MAQVFADHELARRLESAEGQANADYVEARAKAYPEIRAEWIRVSDTFVMFDGAESPCTQTFGLGILGRAEIDDFDAIESFFRSRGAHVDHEICPIAAGALHESLNQRGYRPIEFSNVLYRELNEFSKAGDDRIEGLRVELVEPSQNQIWSDVAAEGWRDKIPELVDYLREQARVNEHRHSTRFFLAYLGDEPVAAAALAMIGGVATLAGAATIPKFRKRGAQQALFHHRLRYGREHGCDISMIVAEPGSSSQRNAERQGFRVAYTRTKWRLDHQQ